MLQALDLQLLAAGEAAGDGVPTDNLAAYDLYLQGKAAWEEAEMTQTREPMFEAVRLFEEAVELDADFAAAWAELSEAHAQIYFNGVERTEERLEMARQAVDRALEINPDLPGAHVALGHYYYWGPRDYERAIESLQEAERSLPNDPDLLASIAYVRRRQGRFEEALEKLQRAVELDPRGVTKSQALGTTYLSIGRNEAADQQLTKALEINPEAVGPLMWRSYNWYLWKGDVRGAIERMEPVLAMGDDTPRVSNQALYLIAGREYNGALEILDSVDQDFYPNQFRPNSVSLFKALARLGLGETEKAREAAARAAEALEREVLSNPDDPRMHGALGIAYAILGRDAEARRESERALKLQPLEVDAMEAPARLWDLAVTYALLGDADSAIETLDRMMTHDKGWMTVPTMEGFFVFDGLRDHPGYQELVDKHS